MARGTVKLTQKNVEALTCPPGKREAMFFDAELPGFGIRVSASGGKNFLAQYNLAGGKRRVALGGYGKLTPDEARRAAKSVLAAAANGNDPWADRETKAKAARQMREADAFTFAEMVDQWAEARKADRRPSYLREAVKCLRRNLPGWLNRPVGTITVDDAINALDQVKRDKGVVAANRTQAYVSAAFSWAVAKRKIAGNPVKGLERAGGREKPRTRLLTPAELGAIWQASGTLTPVMAGFVRALMMTLARRDEVASMRWPELNDATAPTVWTLPGERAKNHREHIVHLSAPARAAIAALPKVAGNRFVFPGRERKQLAAFSYVKAELDAALAKAGTPIVDWRFHDFRRAGVTALAKMGTSPHVADRLLNHVGGTLSTIGLVYQVHEFSAERAAALDAWAALVVAAAEGRELAGNVVPLVRVA